VSGFFRMRPEHGADGDGGHQTLPVRPPRSVKNHIVARWFRTRPVPS
jgi:hypothetical protein